jgi:hypothetical protein
VLNPSCRCNLDLEHGSHYTIRDFRDFQRLGESQPSLGHKNQAKGDTRSRLHSHYPVEASSVIEAGFPLFVKTIARSSLCLQAQDSKSVFELKTQVHQATCILPSFQ